MRIRWLCDCRPGGGSFQRNLGRGLLPDFQRSFRDFRLRVQFLPSGFNCRDHEFPADFGRLEDRCVFPDGIAHKSLFTVVTWHYFVAVFAQQSEEKANVEIRHVPQRVFAYSGNLRLAHRANLLRLLPPMTHVDDFRSLHCTDVNIVDIIRVAVKIDAAAVDVQVQSARL